MYQRIASEAANLRARGRSDEAIARELVDGREEAEDVAPQRVPVSPAFIAGRGAVRSCRRGWRSVLDEAALEDWRGHRVNGVVDDLVAERRGR